MGFLTRRLLRRFSIFGRIADLLMIVGIVARFAQKRGWLGQGAEDLLARVGMGSAATAGSASRSGNPSSGVADKVVAGGAAWRLAKRFLRRR